jgi:hypothetical protein
MLMYVGNDKLINNVDRYTVLFHAKRSIQEINYDELSLIRNLSLLKSWNESNIKSLKKVDLSYEILELGSLTKADDLIVRFKNERQRIVSSFDLI